MDASTCLSVSHFKIHPDKTGLYTHTTAHLISVASILHVAPIPSPSYSFFHFLPFYSAIFCHFGHREGSSNAVAPPMQPPAVYASGLACEAGPGEGGDMGSRWALIHYWSTPIENLMEIVPHHHHATVCCPPPLAPCLCLCLFLMSLLCLPCVKRPQRILLFCKFYPT